MMEFYEYHFKKAHGFSRGSMSTFRKNNIIKSITREEFENAYGDFMFYDITPIK